MSEISQPGSIPRLAALGPSMAVHFPHSLSFSVSFPLQLADPLTYYHFSMWQQLTPWSKDRIAPPPSTFPPPQCASIHSSQAYVRC